MTTSLKPEISVSQKFMIIAWFDLFIIQASIWSNITFYSNNTFVGFDL